MFRFDMTLQLWESIKHCYSNSFNINKRTSFFLVSPSFMTLLGIIGIPPAMFARQWFIKTSDFYSIPPCPRIKPSIQCKPAEFWASGTAKKKNVVLWTLFLRHGGVSRKGVVASLYLCLYKTSVVISLWILLTKVKNLIKWQTNTWLFI